ncbi:MAG: hypothetical protein ACO1O1_02835 [Adhaeribacter sp.]
MKKYLFTLAIVLTSFLAQAQKEAKTLLGTWELSQLTYNSQSTTPGQNNFKRYKIITPTHFMVVDINASTNVTKTSIFGTYTFQNGVYKEKILHVNQESRGMIGSENSFKIKFQGENLMSQAGEFNGIKSNESWTRVKN